MTALSEDDLIRLCFNADIFQCVRCTLWCRRNYCMDDDEFFFAGHAAGCPALSEHVHHRTY